VLENYESQGQFHIRKSQPFLHITD